MKTKFKVGDKVRVIRPYDCSSLNKQGRVSNIQKIITTPPRIELYFVGTKKELSLYSKGLVIGSYEGGGDIELFIPKSKRKKVSYFK